MEKISFVCTTYRRYTCVTRIIEQYLQQDYNGDKELIIFNTDIDNPLSLDESLNENIIVINNNIDYKNGLEYKNRGQILRDSISHCTGNYFMLADDDDVYLPWHLRQAFDGITENGKDSWKPQKSMFSTTLQKIEMAQNTLEASVIVKMDRIREIGFREDLTGYEGLSWYTKLRDEGQLNENNTNYIPSYCFNWSDPDIALHKQSGDIDNPENFENHKKQSNDISNKPLKRYGENIKYFYKRYYEFLKENRNSFPEEYYNKYALSHINQFDKFHMF